MSKQILKVIALISAIAFLPTAKLNAMDSNILEQTLLKLRRDQLPFQITKVTQDINMRNMLRSYLLSQDPHGQAAKIKVLTKELQTLSQEHKALEQDLKNAQSSRLAPLASKPLRDAELAFVTDMKVAADDTSNEINAVIKRMTSDYK